MKMIASTSDRQPTNARHKRLGLLAGAVSIALVVAGCASSNGPASSSAQPSSPIAASTAAANPNPGVGPLAATPLTVAEGTIPGLANGQSVEIPQGWTAEVWANVPGARLATWTPDGKLLVSSPDRSAVIALTPTEPGKAPTQETLIDELDKPQGLAFTSDGTALVVGESTRVVAYDYKDGKVSNERVLADNLPTGGHSAKGVAVDGDTVYYSVGSSNNRIPGDRTASPARATIWQVNIDGEGNSVVATGVRNGMALAIAPDHTLFSGVNQMDDQPYPFDDGSGNYGKQVPEYINENPVDQVSRVTAGAELGWPLCVPDTRATPDLLNIPYVNDPQFNADGSQLDCAALAPTMLGLPSHSAPLGLSFTAGTPLERQIGSGALITTHGSWNRETPRAPGVAFSPWDSTTNSLGATVPLVGGFQSDNGDRWGRTVAAVVGSDGSLYVTDDEAGLVYRITPPA